MLPEHSLCFGYSSKCLSQASVSLLDIVQKSNRWNDGKLSLCFKGFPQSCDTGTLNSLVLQVRKLRLREVKWVARGHTVVTKALKPGLPSPCSCLWIASICPALRTSRGQVSFLLPSSRVMPEDTGSTSYSGGIISTCPNNWLKFMALAVPEGMAHDHE